MTVHFEDLPLADMVKALDAKLDAMPGGPPALTPPSSERAIDSDTVTRARAQLAAAEAEARRRSGEADASDPNAPQAPPRPSPGSDARSSSVDSMIVAVLAGLRELASESQFREALRQRAMRHLPPAEAPASMPTWEALGLTRDVWARLKKAGKLKDE